MANMGELLESRGAEEPCGDSPGGDAHADVRGAEHAVIVAVRSDREDAEPLSVIVSPRADSADSELLSPGKLSPTSATMLDASEFRMQPEPTYQTLTSISSTGLSPNSYATLTPLQPLPPISTVSDKFAYGHAGSVSGSFTVMQNNLGLGYGYEKHYSTPPLGLGIPHSPLSPQSPYSQGLQSPQKSLSPTGYESPSYHPQSPTLSPPSVSLHSPAHGTIQFGSAHGGMNGLALTPMSPHHSPNMGGKREMIESPSPPSIIQHPQSQGKTMQGDMGLNAPTGSEAEEINTKELAQRISAELKRYSIPQAIFAQRVLCRSQGTLSDLLRNPKPWSKLKSGRETFRRMWKWLQEPEFQRMSALRLADPSGFRAASDAEYGAAASARSDHSMMRLLGRFQQLPSPSYLQPMQAAQIPQRGVVVGAKRREDSATVSHQTPDHSSAPKKPRLVFTDLQRRTLQAIFKETKRPSKEMQVTIARQLGLEPTTVGNFFMNARRRSMDKWRDEDPPKDDDLSPDHSSMGQGGLQHTHLDGDPHLDKDL